VGKSVSRVGGKAQLAAYRNVTSDLKLAYAQFEELENFARFGARLDDDTLSTINHGRHIRAYLSQSESDPLAVVEQITLLLILGQGLFDVVPLSDMPQAQASIRSAIKTMPETLITRLENAHSMTDEDRVFVLKVADQTLAPFISKVPADNKNSELKIPSIPGVVDASNESADKT
jgi:F-type H+-transporting ATPase subunit alpha